MSLPAPTKAEILLTRCCQLTCSYCNIWKFKNPQNYREHGELSDKKWGQVPEKLTELGVAFAPIYGAEPLTRLGALLEFLYSANEYDLPTTVITNGVLLNDSTINRLKKAGLDSITLSCDIGEYVDSSARKKSQLALSLVDKCTENFSDVEMSVMLSPRNISLLPSFVDEMSSYGMWTHFDIYHPERANVGCKCKGYDKNLIFCEGDREVFEDSMQKLMRMRGQGGLIHVPDFVIDMMIFGFDIIIDYKWKCNPGAWITVDSDGSVFFCDDFQPESMRDKFPILEYGKTWKWDEFVMESNLVLNDCTGCCWTTHIMSSRWWGRQGWQSDMTHGRNPDE